MVVRVCNCLANREIDFRVEKTDLVHFGYAISNDCSYFVTSDKNLLKYKIPPQLEQAGFSRPVTANLEEFKVML